MRAAAAANSRGDGFASRSANDHTVSRGSKRTPGSSAASTSGVKNCALETMPTGPRACSAATAAAAPGIGHTGLVRHS